MAQLGINGPFLLAQIINFVVLFLLLRRFLFPPLVKMLDQRRQRIAEGLAAADVARKEAEGERARLMAQIEAERAEAQQRVAAASAQAERVKADILAEARREAEAIKTKAVEEAEAEKQRILAEAAERIGRREEAIAAYQAVLAANPDDAGIKAALAKLQPSK